jgi:hypothetical protein
MQYSTKIQYKFSFFYLLLSFLMNSTVIPLFCPTYCHSSFLSSSQLRHVKTVQVRIAKGMYVRNKNEKYRLCYLLRHYKVFIEVDCKQTHMQTLLFMLG